jgi:FlaG/FlaF family flagellin (archaellin)
MSLRAFHLLFIALSVVLAAFVAAWAFGQYRVEHDSGYAVAALASLASGGALAVYGAAFQRKTRNLS